MPGLSKMSGTGFGKKRSWPDRVTTPAFSCRLEKTMGGLRIAVRPSEILNEHLPKESPKLYARTSLDIKNVEESDRDTF
jgi:hypothetical protein